MMDAMEVLDWGWCRRSAGEWGTTAYLHPVAEQDSDRNPDRKNRRRKNGEGPASLLRENRLQAHAEGDPPPPATTLPMVPCVEFWQQAPIPTPDRDTLRRKSGSSGDARVQPACHHPKARRL